ncbi:hypothetical protein [Ferviditalea candida]|uniref:Uncharacterized protein n=1 Tax=Ferviditalea candida TaxID=3108399 RepID=A0ABU5ZC62_9BACL|nr:hypothetical protein [Paenibacillaceae bacterium T2]
MTNQERKSGPDLHTHQSGVMDLNKTIVRGQAEKIEERKQGPGAFDARDQEI